MKKYFLVLIDDHSRAYWRMVNILIIAVYLNSCATDAIAEEVEEPNMEISEEDTEAEDTDSEDNANDSFKISEIDLNHWKVTLPIGENGKPIEIEPPEILNYRTNSVVKPYMYNDSTDGGLVFYTTPGITTTNSSYSRTELREQLVPGSNGTNWTFAQGGIMKGTLTVNEISTDITGKLHRVIIMQIHGRLTNAQRDLIGEDDNNAPPVLKIYWQNGKIRVKTKVLKDVNATDEEILHTDAWEDDEGYTFPDTIGNNQFDLEVRVSNGRMEVVLNNTESVVYDDIHMEKWGVFENYFKAGNYLQTIDANSFAKITYYKLLVEH